MNNPPCGPFDKLTAPSESRGFDSGLYRPALRASLEPFDRLTVPSIVEGQGAKHRVETCGEEILFFAGAYSRSCKLRE